MEEEVCVSEENSVLGIPLIVEIDLVHIDFELAIAIAIHIEPALL